VVHYLSDPEKSASRLEALPSFQSEEGGSRNLCLERIGASGLVVAAMSTYFASSGRGNIVLRPLDKNDAAMTPAADKTALAAATVGSEAPSPNQSIQLFGATPKVASKKKKKRKHLAVVDTPVVTAQTKEPVAARVSVDNNAGHDPSTKTPEGAAVSPEQRLELTNVPKQKTKKNGAMMKYLRPAEEGKAEKASQVHTPTLPRRLHQEPGSMKPKHLKGNVKKMPAAVSSKKSRTKTPPKGHLLYDSEKQARKLEDASNLSEQPSKPAEKVKAKRVRSPCVPRKRQHHKSSVTPRPASSQRVSRGDTLRKFITIYSSTRPIYIVSHSPTLFCFRLQSTWQRHSVIFEGARRLRRELAQTREDTRRRHQLRNTRGLVIRTGSDPVHWQVSFQRFPSSKGSVGLRIAPRQTLSRCRRPRE
jgi:hypothetical protein